MSVNPLLKFATFILLYAVSAALFLLACRWGRRDDFASLVQALPADLTYAGWKSMPRRQRKALAAAAVAPDRGVSAPV